jgi:D-beta-D-heptose 7-phosphate kinase/D-beta-D-heptose 1-phosphate adenosyltransferase
MKRDPGSKILTESTRWRYGLSACDRIVFTNGCFGLLHPGHVWYLQRSSCYGRLVVAVNSDESYRTVKGREPAIPWSDRALMVASLESVDVVLCMNETTPHALLRLVRPDFLIKSDTSELPPVGHEVVESYGGRVLVLPAFGGYSTTALLGYPTSSLSL